jgi:uncharacterized protein (DUF433 family)
MATVDLFDRITVEPGKCGGKPCIRGMRITVRRVLELLAAYPDQTAILAEYPFLDPEDFQQALRYAAATVDDERLSTDRVAGSESYSTRVWLPMRRPSFASKGSTLFMSPRSVCIGPRTLRFCSSQETIRAFA